MDNFVSEVIRDVSTRFMQVVAAYPPKPKLDGLSKAKINRFRKQAQMILFSDVFTTCVRDVVDQCKEILLTSAITEGDMLVNRGEIMGVKNLVKALEAWCAGSQKEEPEPEMPEPEDVLNKIH